MRRKFAARRALFFPARKLPVRGVDIDSEWQGRVGGGGGESNSPSKKDCPEFTTSVVCLFNSYLADLNGRSSARPVDVSFAARIDVRVEAPRLNVTQSRPARVKPGWMCYQLIRQQLILHHRQLLFVTCLMRVVTSSACNSVTNLPCRNHAPPIKNLIHKYNIKNKLEARNTKS